MARGFKPTETILHLLNNQYGSTSYVIYTLFKDSALNDDGVSTATQGSPLNLTILHVLQQKSLINLILCVLFSAYGDN